MTAIYLFGGIALASDGFVAPQGGAVQIANVASLVWILLAVWVLSQAAKEEVPAATVAPAWRATPGRGP